MGDVFQQETTMRKRRPIDLRYSDAHIWVRIEEDNNVFLGVTDYLVKDWEDPIRIDLPKVKEIIEQDTSFGEIESETTSATLISPVTGKIMEINKAAIKRPNLILESPYEDGWLIRTRLDDLLELDSLMDRDKYEESIEDIESEEYKELEEE